MLVTYKGTFYTFSHPVHAKFACVYLVIMGKNDDEVEVWDAIAVFVFAQKPGVDPEILRQVDARPDPEPLVDFGRAVRERTQAGGHAEAAHRCATLLHLANIAIRTGRTLQYDPVKEQIIGDAEANRLVNVPMRSPWHL